MNIDTSLGIGPRMRKLKNIYGLDMHISEGRLYVVTITGQQE